MKGFLLPEGDVEEYDAKLYKLLFDKHEKALLYTEKGLRAAEAQRHGSRRNYRKLEIRLGRRLSRHVCRHKQAEG